MTNLKKLGIVWLTALTLWGAAKEGIAKTNDQTNKNIQEVFSAPKTVDQSKNYVATAADFAKSKTETIKNSTEYTEMIWDMSDLIKDINVFYGKDTATQKIESIIETTPNFIKLWSNEQRNIIESSFSEFVKDQNTTTKSILIRTLVSLVWALVLLKLRIALARGGH